MKEILKNISPLNNRTEMSAGFFVIKKILAFFVYYIAGLFVAEGVVILLHFALGKNVFAGEMFDAQTIKLITYYGYFMIAGIALLYWKWVEKKPFSEMGITRNFGSYFWGVFAGFLLLFVSVLGIILTGGIQYCGIFESVALLVVFLMTGGFLVQGATEEILCRGVVLHSLKEKTSVWTAVTVSTILFILPHGSSLFTGQVIYSIIGAVNLILISLLFSLFTIRFQSIWAACGLHSIWNALLYSIFGLNLSGSEAAATAVFDMQTVGKTIWNGGDYGIEASIITTIVLSFAAVLVWWLIRKNLSAEPYFEKNS